MPGMSRRQLLQAAGVGAIAQIPSVAEATPRIRQMGLVQGQMTGAEALVETLQSEGCDWVYGIPGAQENELWDTFKTKRLGYLLVTHEFSAACMADGYARSTGKPGVLCIVPGPGITNCLSGLGEALLDSVPVVCVVGDVANGRRARPFQVHCLDNVALLRPVCKQVISVQTVNEIPGAIRQAFALAKHGEPGPVAVVVPYNLFMENHRFGGTPIIEMGVPFDDAAFRQAMALLSNRRARVGIYAGMGCMDFSDQLVRLAEVLQAPVATSMCGKGVIPETHPLAVGWGYGPQGTRTAQHAFNQVDTILAIGVKFSEVSTGFYSQPQPRCLIHVDANRENLGRVLRANVCVHADAGVFLTQALADADCIRRPVNETVMGQIRAWKREEERINNETYNRCGVDPMRFIQRLRAGTCRDALAFVDVTVSQYWATEAFTTYQPRTFFNPTDNQAMGWSIPAAIGAKRIHGNRQVVTITGDGCFLMSATEISTAAREHLPVKFFILDDQAYHYMQELQLPAYLRTTATILARIDYRALAQGYGVGYEEILSNEQLDDRIRGVMCRDEPVLVRVAVDYRRRTIRWLAAARERFINELTMDQKIKFLARAGTRAVHLQREND
jgi:acetolactate synthase-1/2/3 large subunit